MSTKGDEQGKKITTNTIALKTRVPVEGTQESRQIFLCLQKKGNWTTYSFSFFLNTVVPLNLVI